VREDSEADLKAWMGLDVLDRMDGMGWEMRNEKSELGRSAVGEIYRLNMFYFYTDAMQLPMTVTASPSPRNDHAAI
jgi:hypothetical protein